MGELLDHELLKGRFKGDGSVVVVGDCRAAALMLLRQNGPKDVQCFGLTEFNYDPQIQDMNRFFVS